MKFIITFQVVILFFCQTGTAQSIDVIVNSLPADKQKADTLYNMGRKFHLTAKLDSAEYCFKMALGFADKIGYEQLYPKLYTAWSKVPQSRRQPQQALDLIAKARPYINATTSAVTREQYLLFTAYYFQQLRANDSAQFYFQVLEKFNNETNPYRNWVVYDGLGQIFLINKTFDKAEQYYKKAYELTKAKGVRMDHGLMLNRLAYLYMESDNSRKFADIDMEYREFIKAGKKDYTKDVTHSLITIDWGNTSEEEKIRFVSNVKQEHLKNGNKQGAAMANSRLALIYEEANLPEKALACLEENERSLFSDEALTDRYINARTKYKIQKKTGKDKDALKTADLVMELNQKLTNVINKELTLDLEAKYQTEKKEKEIALLNTNNELAKKEIALLSSQKELDFKTIALLNSQKKLSDVELQRQLDIQQALARENQLMDSVVSSEKAYSLVVTREKEKETALNAALGRENSLKAGELTKEKKLRQILIGGAGLLLLAGAIILFQYRKQRIKNLVIQKQSDDLQVLMKEIHHRVKNNLQVISSLLDLQSMTIADNQASEAVKEGKNRVQSMALIHQNLYSEGNIKGIKAKEYISNLLQSLCDSYNITNDKVKVNTQIDDLNLDVDTMIPLGLVLNELVSNSLKYAFKNGRQGELSIVLKEEPHHLLLKVSDNGTGYPEGMNAKEGKSFGMKMIRAFAQKLKAKLDVYNNNGAVVEMQITKYNLA